MLSWPNISQLYSLTSVAEQGAVGPEALFAALLHVKAAMLTSHSLLPLPTMLNV